MITYRDCVLYTRNDPNKTPLAYLDLEAVGPLNVGSIFSLGDQLAEDVNNYAITETEFKFVAGNYNIIIPDVGDMKITGYIKTQSNIGNFKRKYRYRLTLEA